jgi:hypothetical protein
MKLFATLLVLAVCAPLAARAAPPAEGKAVFGIPLGASVKQIEGARQFKPNWFQVAAPPKPDPRFEKVAVEAFGKTGVCVVQGVSPLVRADADGAKIRAAIDTLADDFSARYGQPEKLDACKGFACAPQTWGEDMQIGDRRYGYRWDVRGGPIRTVSVVAVAHSVSSFTYVVQFDSAELTQCRFEELSSGAED